MGLFMKLFQKRAKVNADQKHDYDLTYDDAAITEIHTHKVKESDVHEEDLKDAHYDSVAIPEVHIKNMKKN